MGGTALENAGMTADAAPPTDNARPCSSVNATFSHICSHAPDSFDTHTRHEELPLLGPVVQIGYSGCPMERYLPATVRRSGVFQLSFRPTGSPQSDREQRWSSMCRIKTILGQISDKLAILQ
jgi:hypothetical protein